MLTHRDRGHQLCSAWRRLRLDRGGLTWIRKVPRIETKTPTEWSTACRESYGVIYRRLAKVNGSRACH
jgi:hypothetical protein